MSDPPRISEMRRDALCWLDSNWRCDLLPYLDVEDLERRLEKAGFQSRCRHPNLRVLRHPEGHELAWVVSTGRVQIRVDLGVAAAERRDAARRLHSQLASFVEAMPPQVLKLERLELVR